MKKRENNEPHVFKDTKGEKEGIYKREKKKDNLKTEREGKIDRLQT